MMKSYQRPILVGCALIGIGCIVLFSCIGMYLLPQRELSGRLSDLLVEPSMVPEGWELADGREWEPIPERAVVEDYRAWEGVIRTLRRPEPKCKGFDHITFPPLGCDTISHKLLRYGNEWQARAAFSIGYLPALTRDSERWMPEGWAHNFKAEQFRFGCTKFKYDPRHEATVCTALARYGRIISIITIRLFTDRMSLEEMQDTLRKIDAHMAHQLGLAEENQGEK